MKNRTVYLAVVLSIAVLFSPLDIWKAVSEKPSFNHDLLNPEIFLPHCLLSSLVFDSLHAVPLPFFFFMTSDLVYTFDISV